MLQDRIDDTNTKFHWRVEKFVDADNECGTALLMLAPLVHELWKNALRELDQRYLSETKTIQEAAQ